MFCGSTCNLFLDLGRKVHFALRISCRKKRSGNGLIWRERGIWVDIFLCAPQTFVLSVVHWGILLYRRSQQCFSRWVSGVTSAAKLAQILCLILPYDERIIDKNDFHCFCCSFNRNQWAYWYRIYNSGKRSEVFERHARRTLRFFAKKFWTLWTLRYMYEKWNILRTTYESVALAKWLKFSKKIRSRAKPPPISDCISFTMWCRVCSCLFRLCFHIIMRWHRKRWEPNEIWTRICCLYPK